jgi:hypothetical protein
MRLAQTWQIAFVMERIKSMLERVGEARLKRLAAAAEPKAEATALTTGAEFEALKASRKLLTAPALMAPRPLPFLRTPRLLSPPRAQVFLPLFLCFGVGLPRYVGPQ